MSVLGGIWAIGPCRTPGRCLCPPYPLPTKKSDKRQPWKFYEIYHGIRARKGPFFKGAAAFSERAAGGMDSRGAPGGPSCRGGASGRAGRRKLPRAGPCLHKPAGPCGQAPSWSAGTRGRGCLPLLPRYPRRPTLSVPKRLSARPAMPAQMSICSVPRCLPSGAFHTRPQVPWAPLHNTYIRYPSSAPSHDTCFRQHRLRPMIPRVSICSVPQCPPPFPLPSPMKKGPTRGPLP